MSLDTLPTFATSMQQLTFVAPGKFEWREVQTPTLQNPGEALVQPLAVTRCDLDLYIATGMFPVRGEFAFGHEVAGLVVDVGNAVTSVAPGDLVIVPFQISCGGCAFCLRGETNACTQVPAFSAYGLAPSSGKDWGGGLSDLLRVPFADAMLIKKPPDLSLTAAASLADNAVDGYRTVAEGLRRVPQGPVLVVGGLAQSVGLFAVQAAMALGADRVVYCDNGDERLALAKTLGAEVHKMDFASGELLDERFPVVVEAGSYPQALVFALRHVEACGQCIGVSSGADAGADIGTALPLREMYMKGVRYEISRVHARGTLPDVLKCTDCGFDPDRVIARSVPFSEAADAMCDPDIKLVFERAEYH